MFKLSPHSKTNLTRTGNSRRESATCHTRTRSLCKLYCRSGDIHAIRLRLEHAAAGKEIKFYIRKIQLE